MRQPEPLGDQPILQPHHVGVAVARKLHPQPVARLARLPVPDVVGQDDEVALGVVELPFAVQPARKAFAEKLRPGAAGAVQDQDAVSDDAIGVLARLPDGSIVNLDLGQRFAAGEGHVFREEVALDRRGIALGAGAQR